MKKEIKIISRLFLFLLCGFILIHFHSNRLIAVDEWSGNNVDVIEGGYRFISWDDNGGVNRLDYNGEVGINNTIEFEFTPSTTGNGHTPSGDPNISFVIETNGQKIRTIIKPSWKAAYVELDGTNVIAANYESANDIYSQSNAWFKVKFVFETGYTELTIDYLGDGLDVFHHKVENINFTLHNNPTAYFTSWGANAGVRNIEFSDGEYVYDEQLWTGTNVTEENGMFTFNSWNSNGAANTLKYNGDIYDYNVVRFQYTPSVYDNGHSGDTSNLTFAVQTNDGLLRLKIMPYWSAVYLECNGSNLFGENHDPYSTSWNNINEWFAVEFIYGSGYAKISIDYLCDDEKVFTQELKRFDFVLDETAKVYFTSWGANFAVRNIEFDCITLDRSYLPVDLEFNSATSIIDMYVENGDLLWNDEGYITASSNSENMLLKMPDVDNIPGHKYSMYLPLRNTILARIRNNSDAEKIILKFKNSFGDIYEKAFTLMPNSDYQPYYFNVSDCGVSGYLVSFSFEVVGILGGSIDIDAISFEREAVLYDYAAEHLSCVAADNKVTISGQLKRNYAGKEVKVYTTSVANNLESLNHERNKLIATCTADSTGYFRVSFPLRDSKNVSHLASIFLASVGNIKLSDAFRVENWRDFVDNPYQFSLNNLEVKVTDEPFSAKGDAYTNDNNAIQAAIDYVSAQGGGTVILPGDNSTIYGRRYMATNLVLKSNVELRIEKNAILWQSPRAEHYNYDFYEGHDAPNTGIMWDHACNHNQPLILLRNVENVRITGGGVIRMMDWGNEEVDGSVLIGTQSKNCRSVIHIAPLFVSQSKNIEISSLQIQRTSNWNITTNRAENLFIGGMYNRDANCCNSDGFGLTNAKNVLIACSFFNGNDDSITINGVYNDPRKVEDWNQPDIIGDRGTQNVQIMHNQLRGGLGLVFCPWGTDNPDLSGNEIKNIVAYDNRFEGWQNVGSWPDNPFYGISAGNSFSYSDGEEEDSSPIKDIYFYNNTYDTTAADTFVFTVSGYHVIADATNVNTDSSLMGASEFMNPSFEINYRFAGEENWVSGLSYWSMVENGDVNFGYEAVGVKTKIAKVDRSVSQMIDYAAYVEGNGKLYQGIYLREGVYQLSLRTKSAGEYAKLFVGKPILKKNILDKAEVEILASTEVKASDDFVETTLIFEIKQAGNYAMGVYATGTIEERIYLDDIKVVSYVDIVGPKVEIETVDKAELGDTVKVSYTAFNNITGSADLDVSIVVTKDGKQVELVDNSFVAEMIGNYLVQLYATDVSGNMTVVEKIINIEHSDNIKPNIELKLPHEININEKVLITYSATDNETGELKVELTVFRNEEIVPLVDNAFIALEGKYLIILKVTDAAGNTSTIQKEIDVLKKDTSAATIVINNETSATAGDYIKILYTVSDDITSTENIDIYTTVTKDGVSIVYEDGFIASEGEYEVIVKAIDEAGNISSANLIITVAAKQNQNVDIPEQQTGCKGNAKLSIIMIGVMLLMMLLFRFKNRKKVLTLIVLSLLFVVSGCKIPNADVKTETTPSNDATNVPTVDETLYNVTVCSNKYGEIIADADSARKGDVVSVSIVANIGYRFVPDSLKVNNSYISNNKFVMPDSDVTISGEFEVDGEEKLIPSSSLSLSNLSEEIKANIFVELDEEELKFNLFVMDQNLSNNDYFDLFIAPLSNSNSILYGTYKFRFDALGKAKLYQFNGADFVEKKVQWDFDFSYFKTDDILGGYQVNLSVPYTSLGIDKDEISICPLLVDEGLTVIKNEQYGCDETKPISYLWVSDDNTFEINPNQLEHHQLGFINPSDVSDWWDLSADYYWNHKEYPNRVVKLLGSNRADNNLAFCHVNSELSYTTMDVTVTDVFENEEFGKFGLKYVDDEGNGIFFFMDVAGSSLQSMSDSCDAGYVLIKEHQFIWNTHVIIQADYNPKNGETINFSVIRKGQYFELGVNGVLLGVVQEVQITGNTYPVIVSFNLGLEISNYYATAETDEIDEIYFEILEENNQFAAISSSLVIGSYWDLKNDNLTAGPVYLQGHDALDNHLLFKTIGTDYMYARATIKVTDYYNQGDKYMKFGLTLFDGISNNDNKVMFYVDAWANDPANAINDIAGNSFGYSLRSNNKWQYWNNINSKSKFNLETKIIKMELVYLQNSLFFYADEQFIGCFSYTAQSKQLVMGIKCFGLGLEVSDYYCTNDYKDENISDYILTAKTSYHFIGSNLTYGNGESSFADGLSDNLLCFCSKQSMKNATLKDYLTMVKQTALPANVEAIVFELPMQDALNNTTLGELSDVDSTTYDLNTVVGAIEALVAYVRNTYNCNIIFYTSPYCNNSYYEEMIEALISVEEKWSISVLDYYNYRYMTELDAETLSEYMQGSYLPNNAGYAWMNKVLTIYLRNLYNNNHLNDWI